MKNSEPLTINGDSVLSSSPYSQQSTSIATSQFVTIEALKDFKDYIEIEVGRQFETNKDLKDSIEAARLLANTSSKGSLLLADIVGELEDRGNFTINVPKLVDLLFRLDVIMVKDDIQNPNSEGDIEDDV